MKKILAILLAALMIFTMAPGFAMAEENDNSATVNTDLTTETEQDDHEILVTESLNCKVEVQSAAKSGDVIIPVVTPDKGKPVINITVTDKSGNDISVKDNSFVMPDEDINISVTCTDVIYLYSGGQAYTVKVPDGAEIPDPDEIGEVTVLDSCYPANLDSGWYIVTGSCYVESTTGTSGDVNIILLNGCELEIYPRDRALGIQGAIYVTGNLTFWAGVGGRVSDISSIGGKLIANGGYPFSCITLNYGSSLTINGGDITCYESGCPSAIGGYDYDYNKITINGGNVSLGDCDKGVCGIVTINGGDVSGSGKSAVGGPDVTINGGNITGSCNATGSLTINDGNITGAIGNGSETITINGGTINASDESGINGATVAINGGDITANGDDNGICAQNGSVNITGGTVKAIGENGSGIAGSSFVSTNLTVLAGSDPDHTEQIENDGNDLKEKLDGKKFVVVGTSHIVDHELTPVGFKAAKTERAGNKAYWVCKDCNKLFSDAAGIKETTLEDVTIAQIKTVKLSETSKVYNGKIQKPKVTVKDTNGKALELGTDYSVSCSGKCKTAGSYKVTVNFKGNYSGSKTLSYKITKASNTMKLKVSKKTFKYKTLKSKELTYAITLKTKAQGKVTYTLSSKSKKAGIKVSKAGKITIPKGLKKGTYKITVKAAENTNYKAKSATFKLVVK